MTSWLHHNQAKKRILPSHISNISYGNLIPPTQNTIIRPTSTKLNLFKPIPIIPTFSSLPLDLPIESLYTIDLALSKDDYDITISKINEFTNIHNDAMITFIIPTINRNTLYKSILSILNQTITNWKMIVIFDNCEPVDALLLGLLDHSRILYFSIKKHGDESNINEGHGSAGLVRNIGMNFVTTPWIGFLDDDDTLHKNYNEYLIQEIEQTPNVDLVLFRMVENYSIIPSIFTRDIKEGNIGISFCVKTSLIREGFLFKQSRIEDFTFVKNIESRHKKIVISPFIAYYVREIIQLSIHNLKRFIIN